MIYHWLKITDVPLFSQCLSLLALLLVRFQALVLRVEYLLMKLSTILLQPLALTLALFLLLFRVLLKKVGNGVCDGDGDDYDDVIIIVMGVLF